MFCARCGQQVPETTETCPFCGRSTNIPWRPAPGMSQVWATAPPAQFPAATSVARPQQPVRGWLLFFCICLTILSPLCTLREYLTYHYVLNSFTLMRLLHLAFEIAVGVMLWMAWPVAMVLLRIYFALSALLAFLNLFSLYRTAVHFNALWVLYSAPVLTVVGPSLAFLVGGILYFSLSQRVRATYGSGLF